MKTFSCEEAPAPQQQQQQQQQQPPPPPLPPPLLSEIDVSANEEPKLEENDVNKLWEIRESCILDCCLSLVPILKPPSIILRNSWHIS